jgi:hypothetical protein
LEVLRDYGYIGALSIECEGQGGSMIEKSLEWVRGTMKDLGISMSRRQGLHHGAMSSSRSVFALCLRDWGTTWQPMDNDQKGQ